ncbi:hypothetical protein IG631_03317 [Alternaria alternata]|nr:hypothetical protein IG631_03317 [Alternaria alternata]
MSQPNSKDNRARLPEAAHEDTPGIAGDQARGQAPPYADWQDVALLFASTLLKVNALNEALHHAFQARDAHAFALCDDFVRNFDKCLQDRILALARGETHDVPGHERLPGASMMRWASKNASKTKGDSSTQTVEDDGSDENIESSLTDIAAKLNFAIPKDKNTTYWRKGSCAGYIDRTEINADVTENERVRRSHRGGSQVVSRACR